MNQHGCARAHRASTTPPTSTTRAASASSRTSRARRSHAIVEQGLHGPAETSRTAARSAATPSSRDGAGCLIQIPDRFFREEMAKQGVKLPPAGQYGVGMVFLPRDPASRIACEYEIERAIKDEGQVLLGWRDVPVDNTRPRRAGEAPRAGDPAGLHRPRPGRHGHRRARAQALHHPQELGPRDPGAQARARQGVLRAVDVGAHDRATRACCSRYQVGDVLPGPARIRASSRRSRSCTSASRPTPSRAGTSRTRSA